MKCNKCESTRGWMGDTVHGWPCDNTDCDGELVEAPQGSIKMFLPESSEARKEIPLCTGVLDYFPLALAAVARLSKKGNDKHNPGEPLHWARGKSMDHADCIARHLIDRGNIDPGSGESHTVSLAWRALALLEEEEEKRLGAPISRASKVAK